MNTTPEYEITLDQVLTVYRKVLSTGSMLVSGFFQRTEPTKDGTLGIDKNGIFYYCPTWCAKWLTNPARFQDGVLHEMMHPVIGDMAEEYSDLKNLSEDIVINAMLFKLGMSRCELMEAFYSKKDDPECLLRPYSVPPKIVGGLYNRMYTKGPAPGPLEVAEALRVLYHPLPWVVLIGSHGNNGGLPTETLDGKKIERGDLCLPSEVIGDTAQDLDDKHSGGGAGFGDDLHESYMDIIRARASLRAQVIQEFAVKDKVNKLRRAFEPGDPDESIVPTRIGRREATLLAAGRAPMYYSIPTEEESSDEGVHVFVDVSGSVWSKLPELLGILGALRDTIEVIYQFSNKCVRTSVQEMITSKGAKLDTTGGTDFNCVIEFCIENGIEKALIFTDGEAGCSKENQARAIQKIKKVGLIYFGAWQNKNNWLHKQYGITFDINELLRDR